MGDSCDFLCFLIRFGAPPRPAPPRQVVILHFSEKGAEYRQHQATLHLGPAQTAFAAEREAARKIFDEIDTDRNGTLGPSISPFFLLALFYITFSFCFGFNLLHSVWPPCLPANKPPKGA